MQVFKFGGASVRSADGVRNLVDIVKSKKGDLFVVVSAMGKTTNALELILEAFMSGDNALALERYSAMVAIHNTIIDELWCNGTKIAKVEDLYGQLRDVLELEHPQDYDRWYDRVVSYGELISTAIISEYMTHCGVANRWIDMRRCFVTDDRHRDANIDMIMSAPLLMEAVKGDEHIFVGQGFIGATTKGAPTTLGREGSDYSAAVVASMLDAQSVSIWKDVDGILNADPKIFADTLYIPELTYLDAIELAYSGAQIIHPKTIKPLQNKNIPLYVRPFGDMHKPGSVIKSEISNPIETPILILKRDQILVSVRPKDFSFVLEERMGSIISMFEQGRVKVNLIQSSAVNLSLCVDNSRNLHALVERLHDDFRVVYNDNMELLTIRGYTSELCDKYAEAKDVYLSQKTRKIIRIVRRVESKTDS